MGLVDASLPDGAEPQRFAAVKRSLALTKGCRIAVDALHYSA
jgi:hypothetical protein